MLNFIDQDEQLRQIFLGASLVINIFGECIDSETLVRMVKPFQMTLIILYTSSQIHKSNFQFILMKVGFIFSLLGDMLMTI